MIGTTRHTTVYPAGGQSTDPRSAADTRARRWRRPLGSAVSIGAATFVLTQTLVNVSNFGFHVVTSHLLGPAGYGALGSMLAILTALAVPVGAFETIVSSHVARMDARGQSVDGMPAWRRSLKVGVAGSTVMLAATPLAMGYLHLASPWPWLWLSIYCIPLALTVVPWGMVCGRRRFGTAGSVALVGAATRIGLGVVFIEAGFGVTGAIAATVLGDSVRVALLIAPAGLLRSAGGPGARVRSVLRLSPSQAVGGTVAFAGLWILLGIDTVMARHFLSAVEAGMYAAASTTARAAFFVSQAACVIAVPKFATESKARAHSALTWTLLMVAGLGLGATAGLGLLGPVLLPIVFGSGFQAQGLTLALLGLGATELAVLWVMLQYQLARGLRGASSGWCGVVVAAVAAIFWHPNATALALIMVMAVGVAVVLGARTLLGEERSVPRLTMHRAAMAPLMAKDAVDLTVVVPYYNPGDLLRPNLLNLLAALRVSEVSFEVIAVGDGCTDGSPTTIADLDPTVLKRMDLEKNQGKGAALRLGLSEGRGRYIGFIDADGDLDPALWQPFLSLIAIYRPDVIIGSKIHPLSEMHRDITWIRRLCSLGYRGLVRILFPTLPVHDTQVGIKVFRRELLMDVLPLTVERRFVFDLELLVAARRLGYRRILPAPVILQARTRSTITASSVWRMAVDTVALAWRVHVMRAYDPPSLTESAGPTQRTGVSQSAEMSETPPLEKDVLVVNTHRTAVAFDLVVAKDTACVS